MMGDYMNTDYLKEFEELNHTTESLFDLGISGLLIILKDGTNLTSWSELSNPDDILYLSADFRCNENYTEFRNFKNAKVLILQNYVRPTSGLGSLFSKEVDLITKLSDWDSLVAFYGINWDISTTDSFENMFANCLSLEYAYFEDWDTSHIRNFWGMFVVCCSLKAIDGIENWDLSSAENMESMFDSCMSLEDISFLSDWDMSNVENIFEMFKDCYSLKDASCLNWKFKNLKKGDNLFANCRKLESFPSWYDEDFINQFGIRNQLNLIGDDSFFYKIAGGFDPQDIFVAVGYIKDEEYLKRLLRDSSVHFYARRAALLNTNLKDTEILEEFADSRDYVERVYAIENPNFTNIGIIRRLAHNDKSHLVRFKAENRLKELKSEGIEIIVDYPREFKQAFEARERERASLVLSQWGGYDSTDANFILAKVIFDSSDEEKEFSETFEAYIISMEEKPQDPSLFNWFSSTAVECMEKRVDEDIGFSQLFNNMYKSHMNSTDYATAFLDFFQDILENDRIEKLNLLRGLVDSWDTDCPDDANMHCAYVILNIKKISEDELEERIAKAKDCIPENWNSYPKLMTLMNAVLEADK